MIARLVRRLDRWLLGAAPPQHLALLRIATGAFALVYLLVRLPVFLEVTGRSGPGFDGAGVLRLLDGPPPVWLTRGTLAAALATALPYVVGWRYRLTGPLFGVAVLLLTTYRSSWGQLLWFENVMVIHLLLVGVTRAADAWSLDSRRRRRTPAPDDRYGWVIRVAALVTVASYLLSGIAKLRIGGLDWLGGDTLRRHVAYTATRLDVLGGTPSPLATPFVEATLVADVAAVATVMLELGAPLALVGGRTRNVVVGGWWLLHAGIAATMFVVFPYQLFLVAYLPLFLATPGWPGPRPPARVGRRRAPRAGSRRPGA